eukprot:TRINITY_DN7687_c0_g2_i1.p1 TRINITY_DN7687_c0_g2~~TRINITY_DN7687_c0_g2_i1.p1  ORF type:complete len:335 (-),score=88.03 TRINITY_DN7687_c0_g2_i1:31-1035(-)
MAKWDEADPRWIVQNREDGVNVNNWHWTESDYSGWAKKRLKELLESTVVENDKISVKTSDLTLEGEVSVNTRKQKTFLFYELNLTLKWEGTHLGSNTAGKGFVKVPYISEENDDTDFEVQITLEAENSKEQTILKDEFRKSMIPILKEKIPKMLQELRDVALSKTKLAPKEQPSAKVLDKVAPINFPKTETKVAPKKSEGISTSSFTLTEKFTCAPRDIYEALLSPSRVKAYAGGDAVMGSNQGDKFKLFGGSVQGENVELIPEKKIVQKWRFSSWPENHYSTVTIELDDKGGKTQMKLEQTGIPSDDKERTQAGWQENYWRRIKGIFGFGPMY